MSPLSQQIARSALHSASENIRKGKLRDARRIAADVVEFLDRQIQAEPAKEAADAL